MSLIRGHCQHRTKPRARGFTLVEVVISLAIAAIMFGGMMLGYIQVLRRAEWSAHSLAAHSLAMQRVEQARAAKWDTLAAPPVDRLTAANFPPQIEILDIPISGTNIVFATNFTTIQTISASPPLRLIHVDCVWAFVTGDLFTNTIVTYRAPDQ